MEYNRQSNQSPKDIFNFNHKVISEPNQKTPYKFRSTGTMDDYVKKPRPTSYVPLIEVRQPVEHPINPQIHSQVHPQIMQSHQNKPTSKTVAPIPQPSFCGSIFSKCCPRKSPQVNNQLTFNNQQNLGEIVKYQAQHPDQTHQFHQPQEANLNQAPFKQKQKVGKCFIKIFQPEICYRCVPKLCHKCRSGSCLKFKMCKGCKAKLCLDCKKEVFCAPNVKLKNYPIPLKNLNSIHFANCSCEQCLNLKQQEEVHSIPQQTHGETVTYDNNPSMTTNQPIHHNENPHMENQLNDPSRNYLNNQGSMEHANLRSNVNSFQSMHEY